MGVPSVEEGVPLFIAPEFGVRKVSLQGSGVKIFGKSGWISPILVNLYSGFKLDSMVKLSGFLNRKSHMSQQLVLHAEHIELI